MFWLFVSCVARSLVAGKGIMRPSHGGAAGLREPTASIDSVLQLTGAPMYVHAAPVFHPGK